MSPPDHAKKNILHFVVLALVIAAMGASGFKMILNDMPMTRADTMALGAVSLLAIAPTETPHIILNVALNKVIY